MQADDEAVPAPARRRLVLVLGDERGDRLAQLGGEAGAVGGRGERDLAVDRERGEPLASGRRALDELADLPHHPPGEREEPAGRPLIGRPVGIRRDRGQRGGRDHVRRGRRSEHALDAVALPALLDELDEPVALERPQVVVRLLARQPRLVGERARGARLRERGQQPGPHRIE